MTQEVRIGDLFLLPLSDSVVGIGQVADKLAHELYLVVFEETWNIENLPTVATIRGCTLLFASLSLDAKLWNGDWKIIGNYTNNLQLIARPKYKVCISGEMCVESYRGQDRRAATAIELQFLRNRKTVAPVRLENAMKARLGMLDWQPAYDELYYEYAVRSSVL